jgi:hypothetical protein
VAYIFWRITSGSYVWKMGYSKNNQQQAKGLVKTIN